MKLGDRVYVRPLDVFGKLDSITPNSKLAAGKELCQVTCEFPMPDFIWLGAMDQLRPSSEYE